MSGFSPEWLALREPLDLVARNKTVEGAFLKSLPSNNPKILDLASGAGSTVVALSARVGTPVHWQLTDYDTVLLNVAEKKLKGLSAGSIATRQINLVENLEKLRFTDMDAITPSAFLDLASEVFLGRLVDLVTAARKPFLASLTYDGRMSCDPQHPFDSVLFGALNQHQRTDKGFGPALGPDAAKCMIKMFDEQGFKVIRGTSDWHIAGHNKGFLREFLAGCLRVGHELGLDPDHLDSWWAQRLRQIDAGTLKMLVGHLDFVALPT